MQTYKLNIRDRRQITVPTELLALWEVGIGDSLEIQIKKKIGFVKPQKQIALDAFKELQRVFAKSEIPEKQIQTSIITQRRKK